MANSYTTRLKKRLPAVSDSNWDDEWHDNEKIDEVVQGALLSINRVISGGVVTTGAGLTANWTEAVVRLNGEQLTVSAGNLVMTSTQVNWLSINASGVVVTSLTPPSGDYIPLALVDTDSAGILRIADLRPMAEMVALNKDLSDGVPGLTGLLINFMNALGSIKSFFTNANTAPRTYTFQDRNGTIADDTDLAAVNAALAAKASISSPALTDTPTAPTPAAGDNSTRIATTAFVFANTSKLMTVVAGLNTEGGIIGGDVTSSGNTLTISKTSCLDSTLSIPLSTTADTQVVLPATVNQDFYTFIVRLVASGTYTVKAYTTYNGPASDPDINAFRWISYSKNNGSGVTMPFKQVGGRIDWTNNTNRPVLVSATTASYVAYSISTILPHTLLNGLVLWTGGSSQYSSYDGTTQTTLITDTLDNEHLPVSSIFIKNISSAASVNISSVTLRR